jgi:hypothetical protein
VDVDRLMLTALGGWLSSDFNAPTLPNGPYSITEWKHRATMGRDHEVKVVYAGFLFPFGHPASLIKVTERKIDTEPPLPGRYAFLRQRFFIVVRQQTMTYPEDVESLWTEPRHFLDGADLGVKRLDLANPFSSVSILTRVTPNLETPVQEIGAGPGGFCFFPIVNGSPYEFKILAKDREDNIVEYGGPLMFVERPRNATKPDVEKVAQLYCAADEARRTHSLHGQRVAFAASKDSDGKTLDTTLAVTTLQFDAATLNPLPPTQDDPRFWPVLRTAEIVSPAMNALAGAAAPIVMTQPIGYLANGLDKTHNPNYVFLGVADEKNKPPLSFENQANRSGGFVTPSLSVIGLSGSTGPIGGALITDTTKPIKPQQFFGDMPAKLFGAVELWKLLPDLTSDNMPSFVAGSVNQVAGFLDDLDRLTAMTIGAGPSLAAAKTQAKTVIDAFSDIASLGGAESAIDGLGTPLADLADAINGAAWVPAALRAEAIGIIRRLSEYAAVGGDIVKAAGLMLGGTTLPETVSAKLNWSTALNPWPSPDAALFMPEGGAGKLDLHVEIQAPTSAGEEPTATVACSISPFSLRLLGTEPFISLNIQTMEFTMVAGRKPDVNVVMADGGVVFGGPLSFVNTLSTVIPFDGFSDPPYIDVDAQGITAGFDLSLPDLSVGVLSLCNIALGAKALVPFIGDSLDFTFSFCSRENPFRLTVWLFGGGGFFAITVTPEHCRMLEASFEFGAAVALDFGVASGSIECMAGIYFKLELGPGGDDSELAGYFRLRGEVDVLGLISASIELYLELSYEPPSGKATGKASLSIEVEVLFLSFSVEISCEKKFKGSNKDPKFAQVMGRQDGGTRAWDAYCNAFAG